MGESNDSMAIEFEGINIDVEAIGVNTGDEA
jgi:hypothetical protein